MINTLQSLRGIFAIMIFLSHSVINDAGDRIFHDGGPMGVEYFLVLSGFVLCAGYEKLIERSKIDYKDFVARRLIRIYPLHIFCLLLWAVVVYRVGEYRVSEILPNIFLVQAWFQEPYVFYGCNTPSWCLSVLLFCYMLFPILIELYRRYPRVCIFLYGTGLIAYIVFLSVKAPWLDYCQQVWTTRVVPLTRLLDFVMGMVLWQCFAKLRKSTFATKMRDLSGFAKTVIESVPLAFYIIASIVAVSVPFVWGSQVVWWIPTLAAILIFSLFDKEGGAVSRLFDNKVLVTFGNASFYFYLLHIPIMGFTSRIMHMLDIQCDYIYFIIITLILSIVISPLVSHYIDTPLSHWLKTNLMRE